MYSIGVDLGGANIAVGVVGEDMSLIVKDSIPTRNNRPQREILCDVADLCDFVVKKAGLSAIEIARIGVGLCC